MSAHGFMRRHNAYQVHHQLKPARALPFENDCYQDPAAAPLNRPVFVEVSDGQEVYHLPFPAIRTEKGWMSQRGKPLQVEVLGWRQTERFR